jgi:hypothetical protein
MWRCGRWRCLHIAERPSITEQRSADALQPLVVVIVVCLSAEFGAMGLEDAVRLGYRKELEQLLGDARAPRLGSAAQHAETKPVASREFGGGGVNNAAKLPDVWSVIARMDGF